ncbi:MAG TPA: cytochrome c [Planctomycetes bacterium]|nr:cytochrome c [Planctomycetota bacterium]
MKHSLLFLIAASLAACSASPASRDGISDPGQLLFNGYVRGTVDCYRCHGGDASGTWKGPGLKGLSPNKVRHAIRSGPGLMPSFDEEDLSERELEKIVTWLGTLR